MLFAVENAAAKERQHAPEPMPAEAVRNRGPPAEAARNHRPIAAQKPVFPSSLSVDSLLLRSHAAPPQLCLDEIECLRLHSCRVDRGPIEQVLGRCRLDISANTLRVKSHHLAPLLAVQYRRRHNCSQPTSFFLFYTWA
jgi:hypothetical protein